MNSRPLHILISPLDWGLGHASRCIPIIRFLLEEGHQVSLAGSGLSLDLLKRNIGGQATYYEIPGYNITYNKRKGRFTLKIISQIPSVRKTIRKEHEWLKDACKQVKIDGIISDNRYGLYHSEIPCVIMSHQWQILSGINKWADRILFRWHEHQLRRYNALWIVDQQALENSLAGRMSHPESSILKNKTSYIGHLSQINTQENTVPIENGDEILVLLSGPEPARSILNKEILYQAENLPEYNFKIICGHNDFPTTKTKHIQIIGMATGSEINLAIQSSKLVVCRSGYSTLMDLLALQAKALLIPTPGQTEQEYLASFLSNQKVCYAQSQDILDLKNAIPKALTYKGFSHFAMDVNQDFKYTLTEWIQEISQNL